QAEDQVVDRLGRLVDGFEVLGIHAGEDDTRELSAAGFQATGENNGRASVDSIVDEDGRAQLSVTGRARIPEIVSIRHVDVRGGQLAVDEITWPSSPAITRLNTRGSCTRCCFKASWTCGRR